jgi:hypothetical protein
LKSIKVFEDVNIIANKVERVLNSVNDKLGNEIYINLISKVVAIGDKPTPVKQGKYMKSLLDELSSNYGIEITEKLCGFVGINVSQIRSLIPPYYYIRNLIIWGSF